MDAETAFDVLAVAQRTVLRARLQECERCAVRRLSHRSGLATTPLWPPFDVIVVVCLNGVHLGRVRLEGQHGAAERWYAVPLRPWRPHGPYASARQAARALALAATGIDPGAGACSGSDQSQNTATR